jgi:translation initiation factor IF-2
MSCFDGLFKLKKGELNKLVKAIDKSIPVSKLRKADLLCMYLQLTNNMPQPKTTKSQSKTTKSQSKTTKSQSKPKKQEIPEIIMKAKNNTSIDAMNDRIREINKILNREGYIDPAIEYSLLKERTKLEDYIEFET